VIPFYLCTEPVACGNDLSWEWEAWIRHDWLLQSTRFLHWQNIDVTKTGIFSHTQPLNFGQYHHFCIELLQDIFCDIFDRKCELVLRSLRKKVILDRSTFPSPVLNFRLSLFVCHPFALTIGLSIGVEVANGVEMEKDLLFIENGNQFVPTPNPGRRKIALDILSPMSGHGISGFHRFWFWTHFGF
jgi:hypothetical protein